MTKFLLFVSKNNIFAFKVLPPQILCSSTSRRKLFLLFQSCQAQKFKCLKNTTFWPNNPTVVVVVETFRNKILLTHFRAAQLFKMRARKCHHKNLEVWNLWWCKKLHHFTTKQSFVIKSDVLPVAGSSCFPLWHKDKWILRTSFVLLMDAILVLLWKLAC